MLNCIFLRLPTRPEFETIFLQRDALAAVLPVEHPLASAERFPVRAFGEEPFILLERGCDNEVSPLFDRAGLNPRSRLATWDDYAIMSMVENGLGLSILPGLILIRCPYHIEKRPLDPPARRELAAVHREGRLSTAARAFLDCLKTTI